MLSKDIVKYRWVNLGSFQPRMCPWRLYRRDHIHKNIFTDFDEMSKAISQQNPPPRGIIPIWRELLEHQVILQTC